jgi:hypothetical protein
MQSGRGGQLLVAAWTLTLTLQGTPASGGTVSATDLPLPTLLEITTERQHKEADDRLSLPPFRSSAWLAAVPSVSLNYLRSEEDQGTDETELSLNLPFKSPYLAKQDKALRRITTALDARNAERRALYFSGQLREALWSERIARTRVRFTADKIEQLTALQQRQQSLFEARAANRYSLLLLRQELADARLRQAEEELELARWQQNYRQLTGMGNLPLNIDEPVPPPAEAWQSHPALAMLDLGWERERALIAATSGRSGAWNLALQTKQLDTPGLDERQYGIAVEVPLSLLATGSESSDSEWRESSRRYWQARDELQLQLARSRQALRAQAQYLQKRQLLLQEATEASQALLTETGLLAGENELPREIWLRQILGNLDKRAEAAINELLIGQNRAMSRQAAGIPL